jgi:hypothetical protein
MRKMLSLFVSLFTLQVVIMAGTGKPGRPLAAATLSADASKAPARPDPLAYGISFNPFSDLGQFGILDIGTGRFHRIADLPNGAQGIGRDAAGTIYVVDTNNNLVRINPGGQTEVIGSTGVTTPGPFGSKRVDVFSSLVTGELFLMDYSNNLYSVNSQTGTATLIGATGIPPVTSPIYTSSLSGSCKNLFFTLEVLDENLNPILFPTLYRIDPVTAAATPVGPAPIAMPGSAFIDDTLYGFTVDFRPFGGTEGPHVFSIDTSTAATTLVSDLNVPSVFGAVRFTVPPVTSCKAE